MTLQKPLCIIIYRTADACRSSSALKRICGLQKVFNWVWSARHYLCLNASGLNQKISVVDLQHDAVVNMLIVREHLKAVFAIKCKRQFHTAFRRLPSISGTLDARWRAFRTILVTWTASSPSQRDRYPHCTSDDDAPGLFCILRHVWNHCSWAAVHSHDCDAAHPQLFLLYTVHLSAGDFKPARSWLYTYGMMHVRQLATEV